MDATHRLLTRFFASLSIVIALLTIVSTSHAALAETDEAIPAPLPGDYNIDGVVIAADYTV